MNNSELIKKINAGINDARAGKTDRISLFSSSQKPYGKNEFLFFIKPELTIVEDEQKRSLALDQILKQMECYNMCIADITILSSHYLASQNIIAQHYGVINKLSSSAVKNISDNAKQRFFELYGLQIEEEEVLGSLEFLNVFSEFTPLTLDYLWQNKKFEKLAGGTYVLDLDFNGRRVFLINGFHPRQLDHFTRPGRCIVLFTLLSDTRWTIARNDFIGTTDPSKAKPGSLRRYFLDRKEDLGLISVSSSWNGVHLSAGPVEGLVELIRYNSDRVSGIIKTSVDYSFGNQLVEKYSPEVVDRILSNDTVDYQGQKVSVFDMTEEKDSDIALKMLSEIF